MLHGKDAAALAAETARQTFAEGGSAAGLPTIQIAMSELVKGISVSAAFTLAGLVSSNGETKRQIQGGGLRISDVVVTADKTMLTAADVNSDGVIKLSLGKKKHVLLKPA